jgi:GTPase SAR1 family protein
MSQPSSPPTAAPADAPAQPALCVVVFGMPAAGKSSLLGALAQAAQTQADVLSFNLVDPAGGLAELRKRLYEERPRETLEEVAPYDVTISSRSNEAIAPIVAELIDCNGRVANDLLTGDKALGTKGADGALAQSILHADVLVLLVDASAGDATLDRDFAQFTKFLRLLEQSRGQRSDVGGLPVYLVLTKCDLLARKSDTISDWMDRIEERKRQVHEQFQTFLKRDRESDPMPFGSVELHLWATAVKRPALADQPAKPREPYGVAELFRQCFEAAQEFRQRSRAAGRQLGRLTLSVLAAVGCLLLLIAVLTFYRVGVSPLDLEVRNFQAAAGSSAAERLREPMEPREKKLKEFRDDPDFNRLPEELRSYVTDYLQEIKAYKEYLASVEGVGRPSFARDEKTLKSKEEGLTRLSPPAEYRDEWGQTRAERLRRDWLKDAASMEQAVHEAEAFLRGLVKRRQALRDKSFTEDQFRDEFLKLLKDARRSPFRPGNPEVIPGTRVSYADVMRFDRVNDAYQDWLKVQEELQAKVREPRT